MAENPMRKAKSNQSAKLLSGEFWLLASLGLIALLCVYVVMYSLLGLAYVSSSPLSILHEPILAALLTLTFTVTFGLRVLRRGAVSKIARIVAYVMTGFLVFALLWAVLRLASPCTGFFGAPTACIEMHYFYTWLVFFNPISASVLGALSVVGLASLFLKK